jgi:hypothetical protein
VSSGTTPATQFKDSQKAGIGFTISVNDSGGRTLDAWFAEFNACVPGAAITEQIVDGSRALTCTANVVGDILEETIAISHGSGVVYLSSTLEPQIFEQVIDSIDLQE